MLGLYGQRSMAVGGLLLAVAGCQSPQTQCGVHQQYDPALRRCLGICGTPGEPASAQCFDVDSGMIRESGVGPVMDTDASDGSVNPSPDASDGAMDAASDADADAMVGDSNPCGAGREMAGGRCDIRVPRALAPLSTARVSSRTPRLKWALPEGVSMAHVEVCADRVCARLLAEGDAASEWTVPSELPTGVVFWRVRGVMGAERSVRTSPTWWLWVPARSAPAGVQTSWGSSPDLNGDGMGDLVAGESVDTGCGAGCVDQVAISLSADGRLDPTRTTRVLPGTAAESGFGSALATTDVNGDGFADLVVGEPSTNGAAPLFYGSARVYVSNNSAALNESLRVDGTVDGETLGALVAGLGDVNGDGFGDVAISAFGASAGGMTLAGEVRVYFGSASGVSATSVQVLSRGVARRVFGFGLNSVGDVNGDGFADMVVSDVGSAAMPRSPAQAFLYLGSRAGFAAMPAQTWTDMDAGTTFGVGGGGGDFNGDGYADVWLNNIFVKGVDTGQSRIDVYYGGPSGPGATPSLTIRGTVRDLLNADVYLSGLGTGGVAVDVNGDGFDDLIAQSEVRVGGALTAPLRIFSGAAAGLSPMRAELLPSIEAPFVNENYRVALLRDSDEDARPDLVIVRAVSTGERSRVVVVPNSTSGFDSTRRTERVPVMGRSLSAVLSGW